MMGQSEWQSRLDRWFPYGLELSADLDRPPVSSVPCAWVRVTGVEDGEPVVTVYPAGSDRNVWHDRMTGEPEELQPSPRMMRVKLATDEHPMLWTAITAGSSLARRVAPWRAHWQAEAAGRHSELPE
jgi:hypothetical protein